MSTISSISKEFIKDFSFSDDTIASTRSLLTPLYASDGSDGSTESIINESLSQLDGSSTDYEDLPSGNITVQLHRDRDKKKKKTSLKASTPVSSDRDEKQRTRKTRRPAPSDVQQRDASSTYSPWEEWMVQKALLERSEIDRLKQAKRQQKQEEEFKAEETVSTQLLCEAKRREWLAKKGFEKLKRQKEEEAQQAYEAEKERQAKEALEARAKENYDAWLGRKEQDVKRIVDKQRQHQSTKNHLMEKKELESRHAYSKWLEDAKKRPKRTSRSLAYSAGQLKGYYDATAAPTPSYVNPVPWNCELEHPSHDKNKLTATSLYESPPLLWRDVKQRQKQQKKPQRRK